MTRKPASRETLEQLAEAVDEYNRKPDALAVDGTGARYERALAAYRAEITPPLRTRAEVDAELLSTVRDYFGPGAKLNQELGKQYRRIQELCAEPTAPEGEREPAREEPEPWGRP